MGRKKYVYNCNKNFISYINLFRMKKASKNVLELFGTPCDGFTIPPNLLLSANVGRLAV